MPHNSYFLPNILSVAQANKAHKSNYLSWAKKTLLQVTSQLFAHPVPLSAYRPIWNQSFSVFQLCPLSFIYGDKMSTAFRLRCPFK